MMVRLWEMPRSGISKGLKVASLNVRGMRVISKREQVVTYMKKNTIDLLCLQETKIPSSSIEQRSKYAFVFASSAEGAADLHGVGFCYNRMRNIGTTTYSTAAISRNGNQHAR